MNPVFSSLLKQFVVALLVMSGIILTSCSKKEYPSNLTFIPKESSLVACVDIEALIRKADMKELKKSAAFAALSQEAFADQPALKAILDDPSKSGIDFKQVFLFLAGNRSVGFTFALKDASDFEEVVQQFGKQNNLTLNIESTAGCKYVAMPQNDSTALVWDKEKALVVANTSREAALKMFATKPEASIVSEKDFAAFYKKKTEVALWTKNEGLYSSLSSFLPTPMVGADNDMMKGTYTHFNLEFKDGEVAATAETTPVEVAKKMGAQFFGTHPNDELAGYFPKQTLMLSRLALNMPTVVQYLAKDKNFAELMTPAMQQALNSLGGDAMFSLCSFTDAGFPLPQLALAATVKDKTLYNVVLNQWLSAGQKKELGGYTAVSWQMYTFYLAQRGNVLMLANTEALIKDFAAGRQQPVGVLQNPELKDLKGSPAYCYLNLDVDSYPSSLIGLLDTFGGGNVSKFKSLMVFKGLKVACDPEKAIGTYSLTLKDTKKNSLAVILQKADELLSAK